MDSLSNTSNSAYDNDSKSEVATNTLFDMSLDHAQGEFSSSNEYPEILSYDENHIFLPSEILEWETQNYNEEDLTNFRANASQLEVEEQKSESTVDSSEKVTCKHHSFL